MSTLVDLISEAAQLETRILAHAEENYGEVDIELDHYLSAIEQSIQTKADNYKYALDRLKTSQELLSAQAEQFQRAAKALKLVQEAIKDRMKTAMAMHGLDEVKGHLWRFRLSSSKPSLVLDPDFTERQPFYTITKTTTEPDKERIRSLLENGVTVPGARLEPGFRLTAYVTKE